MRVFCGMLIAAAAMAVVPAAMAQAPAGGTASKSGVGLHTQVL